jgi:hypothetical protein
MRRRVARDNCSFLASGKTIVIKQGQTRIEAVCGKCGAPNRVQAEKGATRVKYICKQCGGKQVTL